MKLREQWRTTGLDRKIELFLALGLLATSFVYAIVAYYQLQTLNGTLREIQRQSAALEQSNGQERDHFARSQRAWLVMDPALPWPEIEVGKRYVADIFVRNVGHTVAKNIRSFATIVVGDPCALPDSVDFGGTPGMVLGLMAPEIFYRMHSVSDSEIRQEWVAELNAPANLSECPAPPAHVMRVFKLLLYEDEFGAGKGLRVCLQYDGTTEKHFTFCPTGNDAW